MVGIISVIGGHFGGGDHFDGGDHFGGGTSLTFINLQENYQTAEIYFYSYHVYIPLNKTIWNYFVN